MCQQFRSLFSEGDKYPFINFLSQIRGKQILKDAYDLLESIFNGEFSLINHYSTLNSQLTNTSSSFLFSHMLLINSRKVMMYKVGSKILNYLPSEDINSSMISPLIDPAGNKFD